MMPHALPGSLDEIGMASLRKPASAMTTPDPDEHLPPIEARCPSCNQISRFTYCGVQQWPPKVAEMLGLPQKIRLWICGNCQSTITETNLLKK
jgi:hypothetical protein